MDDKRKDCCDSPTSPSAQKATNDAIPASTSRHENSSMVPNDAMPLKGHTYGQAGNVE